MKKLGVVILFIALFFVSAAIFAKDATKKETINILTWWGYLAYPEVVEAVEKRCDVKLSFDEYYSNDEFLRRWEGQKEYYDVIIFSDTIYHLVKGKIPHIGNSKLWQLSAQYHPIIKSHYLNRRYPHNIVYFVHSMTGFLWNPQNIAINEKDSISNIFKKASHKYVVIMDDPVEAKKLVEAEGGNDLSIDNFKKLIQNTDVYITNNYSQIYKKSDFAFSYSWSGEAVVDLLAANKQYQFLVHPRLSYITSDLLAQTSNKRSASCVAKVLASKDVTTVIQNKNFYFNPYANYDNTKNSIFKSLYLYFINHLLKSVWIDSIKESDFHKINKEWQLIKISLNNRNRGDDNGINN